ncbi:MAG: hypothetical protein EHM36_15050 [Deltaproteobacteria bacterium]|nr:MAG: hypothetical protein EHM36_15050 [Deltaproteobacteria bacterium]
MIESRYLEFDRVGWTGKTDVWNVISKTRGTVLGQIKWFGAWRQYCFWPSPDTLFNTECMADISKVIRELMQRR